MPSNRVTLQLLEAPTGLLRILPRDNLLTGTQPRDENAPPPAILLDFMYGAAVYKRWGSGKKLKLLIDRNFVEEHPPKPRPIEPSSSEESGGEPDGPTDSNYVDHR